MWLILGIVAIVLTFMNLVLFKAGKDYRLAMVMGISFTALTLCAQYSAVADWVIYQDWGALSDVVPSLSYSLWILTFISIGLNVTPLLWELVHKADSKH